MGIKNKQTVYDSLLDFKHKNHSRSKQELMRCMFSKNPKNNITNQLIKKLSPNFVLQNHHPHSSLIIFKHQELDLYYLFQTPSLMKTRCKTALHLKATSNHIWFLQENVYPWPPQITSSDVKHYLYSITKTGSLLIFDQHKLDKQAGRLCTTLRLPLDIGKPYIKESGGFGIQGDVKDRQSRSLLPITSLPMIKPIVEYRKILKLLGHSLYKNLLKKLDSHS
ncbi:MAG: hypothetical protein WCG14_04180 [Chlamydiia bacterium]